MLSLPRVSSFVIVACAALLACSDDDSSSSSSDTPNSCGDGVCRDGETSLGCSTDCPSGASIDLLVAACTKDVDEATIARHLEPAFDAARAMGPLQQAVKDGAQFASDASSVLYTLSDNPTASALKAPFVFDSATGRYHSTDAVLVGIDGMLDIELHYGTDYVKGGKAGAIITDDFFASASYLVNPRVINRHDYEATIEHDGPGPLVELIGLGTNPASPFTLGMLDATREVGRQLVYAATSYRHSGRVTDVNVEAGWNNTVGTPRTQYPIEARLEMATPEVVVRSASIAVPAYGNLQAVIRLESRSAPFSYDATIELGEYEPKLVVRCPH